MKQTNLDQLRLDTDFKYFCNWSGPDPFTDSKLIITPQHLELITLLMSGKDVTSVAYRWFGKSSIITYKYALWRAAMHHKTIAIFSATEDLAVDKLRIIKTAIESFPQLHRYLGKGIYTWNDKEIWLIDRDQGRQGTDGKMVYPVVSRIKAIWFESKIRGMHMDIIIADDIVVEENTLNTDGTPDPIKIEKTKRDFNSKAVPIRNPWGSILLVGTPQYWDMQNPKESDLLYTWMRKKGKKSFFLPAYNEAWEPSCPELHTKEFLEEQKSSVRFAEWSKEYMLNPVTAAQATIDDDVIDKCKNERHTYTIDYIPKPDEVMILGTDYVYEHDKMNAEKRKLAYFALVTIAYNTRTNKRKVINISYERWVTFTEQVLKTVHWCKQYVIDALALELHGGLKLFEWELKRLVPQHVNIINAGNKNNKFDTITGLPSLEYMFTKELLELAYKDASDQKKTEWLLYEFKHMKVAWHVDVIDSLLRADTVIRRHYYQGNYDPEFSVRKRQQEDKETQLSSLDMEMASVFGPPNQKQIDKMKHDKEQELRYKKRLNNLEENIWVKLSRDR